MRLGIMPERIEPGHPDLGLFIYPLPPTGVLAWRGQNIYISTCLAHQDIALERVGEDSWRFHFVATELGRIERTAENR